MSSIWNVLSKTKEYAPVVSQEELDSLGSGQPLLDVQRVNALNAAKRQQDNGWRTELEHLNQRMAGMPSPDQAESALASLKESVASTVREYKDKISQAREALKEQYLTRGEAQSLNQKVEVLAAELEDFKRGAQMRLNFAEGRLKDAQTWDPQRPRWQELKARAKVIDAALAKV